MNRTTFKINSVLLSRQLWIVLFSLFAFTFISKAQVILPATGEAPMQTACDGTLQDPGGDDVYPNSVDSWVVISPPGAGTVSFSFSSFAFESCCDRVYIHDGPTLDSPLLFEFGSIVPELDTPYESTSSAITVRMTSDGSVQQDGFNLSWFPTSGSEAMADFTIDGDNFPAFSDVLFLDASLGAVSWEWDFDDGSSSTEQSPNHAFTSAGTYNVTLTITNCDGEESSTTSSITIQEPAAFAYDPESIFVELDYGDSTTVAVTFQNTGEGDLVYSIEGPSLLSEKKLQLLSLINGADITQEYVRTLDALNNNFTDYELEEVTTFDAAELAALLASKDVLLIPEQEDCNASAFASFGPVLEDFLNNDGIVVMIGSINPGCLFGFGIFDGTYNNFISGQEVIVNDSSDPIVAGIGGSYTALAASYHYTVTNEDAVHLVDYLGDDIVAYRNFGETGKAVLIGHDYYNSNFEMEKILANSVKLGSGGSSSWLFSDELSGTIEAGESITFDLEFNASNVFGGTYTIDMVVNTNDPDQPQVIIPCTVQINGQPSFSFSQGAFDFGALMIGLEGQDVVTINNPGTDSLIVNSITSSDPAFSVDIESFGLYGGTTQDITISFAPDAITTYDATLTISTNLGDFTISLAGEGLGSPTMVVSPSEITVNLDSGTSTEETITVENLGEGPLTYSVVENFDTSPVELLIYINGVDLNPGAEYENMIAAINSVYTNYNLTTTTTSDPAELSDALNTAAVFLIPEIEDGTVAGLFAEFAETLQSFANGGGNVIFAGTSGAAPIFNSGLLEGTSVFDSGANLEVVDNTHPITQGVTGSFVPSNGFYPVQFFDADYVSLVDQPSNGSAVGYKPYGNGNVAFVGFDFFSYDDNAAFLIANTIRWFGESTASSWLTIGSEGDDNVPFPAGVSTFTVDLDATGLLGGTYTAEILISSNDPLAPAVIVPITIVVVGVPAIEVAQTDLDFGSIIVGNSNSITITISNPGTDSLFVTNIVSSVGAISPEYDSVTVDPLDDVTLIITFSPEEINSFDGTITIENNVEDITLTVTGIGLGAPVADISASEIDLTLFSGESSTEELSLSNNGEGPLNYTIECGEDVTQVLSLTYGINTFNYGTVLGLLELNFDNYELTELASTDPVEIENALIGTDIVFIAEIATYSANTFLLEKYSEPLNEFVNAGGSVVQLGTTCIDCITAIGLLEPTGFLAEINNGEEVVVSNPSHPIMEGISESFFTTSWGSYGFDFTNPDTEVLAQGLAGQELVVERKIGFGKAIYFGFNFGGTDPNYTNILGNSMDYALGATPDWLNVSPCNGQVAVGENETLDITFDATGLLAGVYTFDLIIQTDDPNNPTVVITVSMTVEAFPQAIAFSSNTLSCDGIVTFQDESINEPSSWAWDFGDGSTSTEQNPSHIYEDEGDYTVSLEVCNDIGCDETTYEDFIEVNFTFEYCDTISMPLFDQNLITSCSGVLLDNGGLNDYANSADGRVVIAPPGATSITMVFTELFYESCCDYLQIYDGPDTNADLIGEWRTELPNGDGVVVSTGGALTIVEHTDGSVTNPGFQATWDCQIVTDLPNVDFSSAVSSPCQGIVEFSDQSDNFPSSWTWDFGDGSTSNEQNPEHTFTNNGTYPVTLTSCNFLGCSDYTFDVVLEDIFEVSVDIPHFIGLSTPVIFMDNTVGAIDWQWDFGDGNIAIGVQNPITVYNDPGVFNVVLEVTDAAGCTQVYTTTVEIVIAGINSNSVSNANLKVYPNPTEGEFNLSYDFSGSKGLNIEVLDLMGRVVYTKSGEYQDGLNQSIRLDNAASGLYTVRIQDANQILSKSISIK